MKSGSNQGVLAKQDSDSGPEIPLGHGTPDLVTALWRYRWAVVLPIVCGVIISFLVYLRTPETYESASRLLIESNRPAVLDQMTGDYVGLLPEIEIIQSQLFSDRVLFLAFNDVRMQPFHEDFNDNPKEFIRLTQKSLSLMATGQGMQSLVMVLRFKHDDPELCEASVKSFSGALQTLFDERQRSSRGQLIKLIRNAVNDLAPKAADAEMRYREFRNDAPLVWNAEGLAINPHRERQLELMKTRSVLEERLGEKKRQKEAIISVVRSSKDLTLAIGVISELLDVQIRLPSDGAFQKNLREADFQLAELELDQKLVPLMIERNKYAAQFGDEHPTVKQLDSELELMKSELKRIVFQQTERIVELMDKDKKNRMDPIKVAQEAVTTVVAAINAEIALLNSRIEEVTNQIGVEKDEAIKLAKVEQENEAMLREIEHNRELLTQLNEQMKRVDLMEEEGGTRVEELTAPSDAYRVGPIFAKFLAIGAFLGIVFGVGLAFVLEKNANTFRDPDEITTMLGIPVLSHLPFFKAKTRKPKKGEIDPFKNLDPCLTVVHQPAAVASEAIRSVRTSIMFELAGDGGKVIQVTSPLPGDGKSTIAGNLACSLAQSGKKVIAIDCDLRRPQLSDNFGLSNDLGLTNILNGECEPSEAIHQSPLTTLHVVPSGPIPSNPAEALTLPEMAELLELMRDEYDFIILDTPPLLVVTDPSITASMVDGVLMALRIRRKSKPNARESANILRAVGARILGVVINNSDESGVSDGYRGYGYYRYGRYTSRYYRSNNNGSSGSAAPASVVVSGRGMAKLSMSDRADAASTSASRLTGPVEVEEQ